MHDMDKTAQTLSTDKQLLAFEHGFIYRAQQATSLRTRRHPGVILLSPPGQPMRLETRDNSYVSSAIIVGPRVERSLFVKDTPFAALHVEPSHASYRMFESLDDCGGVKALGGKKHPYFDAAQSLCHGAAPDLKTAEAVFDCVIDQTQAYLGQAPKQDVRMTHILDIILGQAPEDYCFQSLLETVRLSAGRLSHLFTEEIGLSLRSFLIWRKTKEALRLLSGQDTLTTIAYASGFSDSAHFCRTFQKSLGLAPSRFRGDSCVQVYTAPTH
ncbi:MAG: AraC family transcriptional regulator [Pseudomonadota bacterium]